MAVPANFRFELHQTDQQARRGTLHTPHGDVQTPVFMPVGTQGSVKGLTADMILGAGVQMLLANTYHLALRPSEKVVRDLGGLHRFMGWDGPILTDSGGFQLFSLAESAKITESGAVFKSHIDGSLLELTPERAVQIQEDLGSDVAMVLDHVIRLPNDDAAVKDACERSVRWAARCIQAATRTGQAQFAIVQGGLNPALRLWCAEQLVALDFPGYAIGGLSVGETQEEMNGILDVTCPALPADKPRYLMGVGRPQDLLAGIRRGVDLFDCVMPTRNGRNGLAFTDHGPVRIRNLIHQRDPRPLDEETPSLASRHSRGYLRHLFMADEMLGPMLLSVHNIAYYQRLVADARAAIAAGRFDAFCAKKVAGWSAPAA